MKTYDPRDWYWAAADGRLFSSARAALVEATDPAFAAWLEQGGTATSWPRDEAGAQSPAALQEVLAPFEVSVDLSGARAIRLATLSAACGAAILAGFASSALGKPTRYGSSAATQSNYDTAMMMAAQATGPATGANAVGLFKCLDAALPSTPSTIWPLVAHTQAQVVQVWTDCQAMIAAERGKLGTLETQVAAATTVEAVLAIAWG